MTSRLKTILSKVIEDGGIHYGRSDIRGHKGFSQFVRLPDHDHGKDCSRSNSFRNRKRVTSASPAEGPQKHAQNGGSVLKEATAILIGRLHQGLSVNSYDYVDVLQGCFKQKDLESLEQVHDCIRKSGLEQNPFVVNNLLKCYIRCGRLHFAQELFNKFTIKDAVSWTIMMRGYAQHDKAEDAIQVYKQMRNEGGKADVVTYLSALKACASPLALNWGKDIHAHIMRDGFLADLRVGTALVSMYAKCGSVDNARMVFDRLRERDVTTWNAMIGGLAQHGHGLKAFSLFLQMQREGFTPNSITYRCILNARADSKDLAWLKEVHNHVTKSKDVQDLSVNNALILMYIKCGSLDDAKLVFDSMMYRDVVSWTAIIGGLAQDGQGRKAFSLFRQMDREGVVPTAATYMSILNSSARQGALAWVKDVHSHAERSGLNADLRVGSALVNMYAKSGSIMDARAVFDGMEERDVISWTAMIGGLAQHGLGHDAFSLFLQMQKQGFTPDATTYLSILNPCSSTGALGWVKEVHAHAMKAGLDVDLRVGNALVHMYAKIGSIGDASQAFDNMLVRDVVSWTVMIGGLAQHGHGQEALQLFEEMKSEGVKPSGSIFVAVLSACSHAGLVEEGRFHLKSMKRDYAMEPALDHYTCMVDILGRAGLLEEARLFILNMPVTPDIVTWKALLSACRTYHNKELAEISAKECLRLEPLDSSTHVLLSNVYAAVATGISFR